MNDEDLGHQMPRDICPGHSHLLFQKAVQAKLFDKFQAEPSASEAAGAFHPDRTGIDLDPFRFDRFEQTRLIRLAARGLSHTGAELSGNIT